MPRTFSYQWQRYTGTWDDIAAGTSKDYEPTTLDYGYPLRLRVLPSDGSAYAYSNQTDPVESFWGYLPTLDDFLIQWAAKDASSVLLRATNPYTAEGRDIYINANFTGANWALVGSAWRHTAGSIAPLTQTGISAVGKLFKLVYSITNMTTGTLTGPLGTARSSNDTYTEYYSGASTALSFTPTSPFDGDVTISEFKQVNIRASSDYPSSTGRLNVVVNTDMDFDVAFSGANWAHDTSGGTTGYLHTPGSTDPLLQSITPTIAGKVYNYEIEVVGSTTGDITPKAGSTGTGGTTHSGNGVFTGSTTAGGTAGAYFTPSSGWDGKIVRASFVPADSLLLLDGGFETWGSATDLTYWTETVTGTSSVNRESSIVHSGTYAVRLDVDASGNNVQIAQTAGIAGRRYIAHFRAKAGANGVNMAVGGGAADITQVLTTTYTEYYVPILLVSSSFILKRGAGSNGQSIYIDSAELIEINPLDGTISGATLDTGALVAMGGTSLVMDGVNDFVDLYSFELNSILDFTEFWAIAFAEVDSVAYTDGTLRYVARLGTSSTSYMGIAKTTSNNELIYLIDPASGSTVSQTYSTGGSRRVMLDLSRNAATNLEIGFNGGQVGNVAGTTDITGNLNSAICTLGASSTSAANPWDGDIYGLVIFATSPDAVLRARIAHMATLTP